MSRVVVVTGGRDYADRDRVFSVLDILHADDPIVRIVHGGATGADKHADNWGNKEHVPRSVWPVSPLDWKTLGKAAGPIRNGQMLRGAHPHLVVAFPGGKGTADCVRQAKGLGIVVLEIDRV